MKKGTEFFAGATRLDSVPRKSIIGGLSNDPAKRYTASQTLNAKYGTWDFIIIRLRCNHICIISAQKCSIKVHDLIRANDVSSYDAYRATLSKR